MTAPDTSLPADPLTPTQLASLLTIFRDGAQEASRASTRWVGRPTEIVVDRVEQAPLAEAAERLGPADALRVACVMAIRGQLNGSLVLAFDDAGGWALADHLLNQPPGTSCEWGEVERSAAEETANIVGCAYLNALSRALEHAGQPAELIPAPPQLLRDFAAALLESVLLAQAMTADTIFLAETTFHVEGAPADWMLLFVPDAESLPALSAMLT